MYNRPYAVFRSERANVWKFRPDLAVTYFQVATVRPTTFYDIASGSYLPIHPSHLLASSTIGRTMI